jgi:tRNA1Val (adenine37-N6)-methyltransferase
MGRNQYFRFKQFTIVQEKAAMKVGTDGVLLGAWTDVGTAGKILDVGTGTGVIALMMAQRSDAQITAVEIEEKAFSEAVFNFSQSPWATRIKAVHSSFQEFCAATKDRFDLIVSNPPFFENASKAREANRSNARHTDLLPYADLISGSGVLLSDYGRLSVIVHAENAERVMSLAAGSDLFPSRITRVKPKPERPFHRFLIEFSKHKSSCVPDDLTIGDEGQNNFTDAYKNLTRDFYLAF